MLFEVKRDGKRVMYTEFESCIPPKEIRDALRKSGHKIYLDKKIFKEQK